MMRPWVPLAALLLTVTGNAFPDATTTAPAPAKPSVFTPAPMPNQDITSPIRVQDPGPSLSANLQEQRIQLRSGDGFTPGSNFSQDLEHRVRGATTGLAPTLSIKFPLQ